MEMEKKKFDTQYGAVTQEDCHRLIPLMSSCLYFSNSHCKVLYSNNLLK